MKISIITATYNRFDTIVESVQSSLEQVYSDFEIIVQDGGFDSDTESFFQNLDDVRVKYLREPDDGLYDALNRALKRASGDVICFMHSDDFFAHPLVLSSISPFFVPDVASGVYGNLLYFRDHDGSVVRTWRSGIYKRYKLCLGWMPPHPSLFLSRSVYDSLGVFDSSLKISADYDFFLRVVNAGVPLSHFDRVLVMMRTGGVSNSGFSNLLNKWREDYRVMQRNGLSPFFTLPLKSLIKLRQFF